MNLYTYKVLASQTLRNLRYDACVLAAQVLRKPRTTLTRLDGQQMLVRTNDSIGRVFYLERDFEPIIRETIERLLSPGDVAFDIGANIGYYTLQMARIVGASGRVFAMEPSSSAMKELVDNITINKLNNVQVQKCAVARKCGKADYHFEKEGKEAYGSIVLEESHATQKEIVETVDLDTIWSLNQKRKVRLVKMDVEGAEFEVLLGARLMLENKAVSNWVFEANETRLNQINLSVCRLLKEFEIHGYQARQIAEDYWWAYL